MEQRALSFSIDGGFITNLAREKLYREQNLKAAVDLIRSCTESDQLSRAEHNQLIADVLEGRMQIRGVYPGPDYGVFEDVPSDETPGIVAVIDKMNDKIAELNAVIRLQERKFIAIAENLSEYDMRVINRQWHRDGYDASQPESELNPVWIFPDQAPLTDTAIPGLFIGDESDLASGMLSDFMRAAEANTGDDYGWISPSGVFTAVDWGDHQQWARDYIVKHPEQFDIPSDDEAAVKRETALILDPGDKLSEKGWILLHSPHHGIARPTILPERRLTKAQRDFLYGYYADRNLPDMAREYLED